MPAEWLPLAGFALGAIFGSFIAVLVTRWPRGETTGGRSACDSCGRVLGPAELVPLLSFLVQRGRCRGCGARIDGRLVAIEIAAALIGASALFVSPDLVGLSGAIFGWILLALAVLDVEHFWLPDRLTLPLMAIGLIVAALVQPDHLHGRIIGAVVGYLGLSLVGWGYRKLRGREGLGGGDPKLLAGIGAWLGWQALPFVLLLASLAGLATALGQGARQGGLRATTRIAFGAMLAVASWPLWLLWQGAAPLF
ncbi:prepilin peptidase [Sphingomonas colocasiae]|uniref:Prepilin leader peptidase/N-methyltransferase n=1 Tax=Sphingomonas colocasiae TaxID=1848973 RepID=A0ABS7PPG5_9SPHN|nr:A24 family peptidase [Sphingomonas colocasiae]MBY8823128.1 A24 family peptidase [Sphingomonas colocasiae]